VQETSAPAGWLTAEVAHLNLGWATFLSGDLEGATEVLERGLVLVRASGSGSTESVLLNNLAWVALAREDFDTAAKLVSESLPISRELADKRQIEEAFELLSRAAAGTGDPLRAARLSGAAAAVRSDTGYKGSVMWFGGGSAPAEIDLLRARGQLDEGAWADEEAAGSRMPMEEAIQDALRSVSSRSGTLD
jgi:hypothetical protein